MNVSTNVLLQVEQTLNSTTRVIKFTRKPKKNGKQGPFLYEKKNNKRIKTNLERVQKRIFFSYTYTTQ